jgi:hypothetical protein
MRFLYRALPIAILALAVSVLAVPAHAGPAEPGFILFLGNSFVRGIRRPLRDLFEAAGMDVRVKARAPSGWTLARHADRPSTTAILDSAPWTHVFLQEQSDGIDASGYPAARVLDALSSARGAETVFFMTWRDRGVPVESYDSLLGEPGGNVGYVPIAFELDAAIAPAGWAVREVLVAGLGYDLWQDGHHLNALGQYLAACVCFATLTGLSPVGLAAPSRIAFAQALDLQIVAERTVLSDPARWNLPL